MDSAPRFIEILKVLSHYEVEFILVGGVAAILEGAPVSTFDLDIVFLKTAENLERLLPALLELDAVYFDPAGRRIVPDADKLASFRMHRLITSSGSLDVMETIGAGLSYVDLINDTRLSDVEGIQVRILGLETIIRSKEQANRTRTGQRFPFCAGLCSSRRAPERRVEFLSNSPVFIWRACLMRAGAGENLLR